LELDPDNYDALLIKSMSGLATQETSVDDVEKLLQINPDDCRLWFALGSVHMSQGTLDTAELCLKKAIEIYPEFYDCAIALGWCLLLQDKLEEAFNTYQSAATQVPELADSWGGLGLVYALKEDFLKAEQFIQKSQELHSECFLAEIAQVIYYNHKNPTKAKDHLVKALKSTNVPISEKLAFILEEIQGPVQFH
jgi:tetratricopeptide (TPR) repeat protein